jgi:alpha-glucosidase
MKNILLILCFILFSLPGSSSKKTGNEWVLESPDKQVKITVVQKEATGEEGVGNYLFYKVTFRGKDAILESPLGIEREDARFISGLKSVARSGVKRIDEKYTLKTGKCSEVHNWANEQVLTFKDRKGNRLELMMRAYNDGVAFRYRFPENNPILHKILTEQTGFSIPKSGKAWIHPYDWNSRKKPSYEQYCQKEIAVGSASPYEKGWAFPMLFNTNGLWIMVTEALLDGSWCGTHIQTTPNGMYRISLAEQEEAVIPDSPEPVHSLPWASPWRAIVVGENLVSIVETNLVQNLNEPCRLENTGWIRPGRASWSWWSDGGSPRDFKKQIDYVDFTAGMGWEYMLIDAGWPEMKGGSVGDVIKYANSRNVGVWLWYHSGAGIQKDTITVRNLMSVPAARRAEFARLQSLGVKGVKVDFFDTDKQNVVRLYKEILEDAAESRIMVNFHGASLPRGLERTYPNLLTTEAVRGAESLGRQEACDMAPNFHSVLPFTRNVVGSMDYTPVTFSNKVRQGTEARQRTTYAHQLALSVVFESGIQDFADRSTFYDALPDAPKDYLKKVPVAWDETRLVAGYPGDFVVMARRKGNVWYIAGINGKEEQRDLTFRLPFIPAGKKLSMITDGSSRTEFSRAVAETGGMVTVGVLPYGGFAGSIEL